MGRPLTCAACGNSYTTSFLGWANEELCPECFKNPPPTLAAQPALAPDEDATQPLKPEPSKSVSGPELKRRLGAQNAKVVGNCQLDVLTRDSNGIYLSCPHCAFAEVIPVGRRETLLTVDGLKSTLTRTEEYWDYTGRGVTIAIRVVLFIVVGLFVRGLGVPAGVAAIVGGLFIVSPLASRLIGAISTKRLPVWSVACAQCQQVYRVVADEEGGAARIHGA